MVRSGAVLLDTLNVVHQSTHRYLSCSFYRCESSSIATKKCRNTGLRHVERKQGQTQFSLFICINENDADKSCANSFVSYDCIMTIEAKLSTIGALTSVRSGYPFRGSIDESSAGDVLAVQMRDVDADVGVSWNGVIRTSLAGRKQPEWLKAGDVLFVSKGVSFYAVCIDEPPSPAVCSCRIPDDHKDVDEINADGFYTTVSWPSAASCS